MNYGIILMKGEETSKKLFEELNSIKKQLGEIKEHMVDIDSLLTAEEQELVLKCIENEARGRLISLKKFEELRSQNV